jgi:hypothetical protein
MLNKARVSIPSVGLAVLLAACSSSTSPQGGSGGNASGGSAGNANGGMTASTGGRGGANGGTTTSGSGDSETGGVQGTGGAVGTGGAGGTGGTSGNGGGSGADGGGVDVLVSPDAQGFPCSNDSDCCIEIDGCMNVAYLYSRAPGAAPAPTFSTSPAGVCTACIPPAIQVRCVQSQCVGDRIIFDYPLALIDPHCGPIDLDGGTTSHALPIDASAPAPATSVWYCGH